MVSGLHLPAFSFLSHTSVSSFLSSMSIDDFGCLNRRQLLRLRRFSTSTRIFLPLAASSLLSNTWCTLTTRLPSSTSKSTCSSLVSTKKTTPISTYSTISQTISSDSSILKCSQTSTTNIKIKWSRESTSQLRHLQYCVPSVFQKFRRATGRSV